MLPSRTMQDLTVFFWLTEYINCGEHCSLYPSYHLVLGTVCYVYLALNHQSWKSLLTYLRSLRAIHLFSMAFYLSVLNVHFFVLLATSFVTFITQDFSLIGDFKNLKLCFSIQLTIASENSEETHSNCTVLLKKRFTGFAQNTPCPAFSSRLFWFGLVLAIKPRASHARHMLSSCPTLPLLCHDKTLTKGLER